ncbi:MAG: hypothetical protein Q4C00_05340 [Bacillota bacterium]|nr:hypothetical protein [Bacillota bacterium]
MEKEFVNKHKKDTREQLLMYLRREAQYLDHIPSKEEILGSAYLRSRLGPWPRALEAAGIKAATKNTFGSVNKGRVQNRTSAYQKKHEYDAIIAKQRKARNEYYSSKAATK